MRDKGSLFFAILTVFLSMGVFSCSTERKVSERDLLIKSLPQDNSWFTKARLTVLKYGKGVEGRPLYIWSSKKIRINGEILNYDIAYFTLEGQAVVLSKKHGSFQRVIVYNEGGNKYHISDYDFDKLIAERDITKEEAEEFTYYYFKELDRYGLIDY